MKRKPVFIFCLFILILSLAPAAWLISVSYDEFCHSILTRSGKLYKLAEFQNQYFSQTRFNLLRAMAFTLPFLISAVFIFAAKNSFIQKKTADFLAGIGYLFGLFKKGVSNIPAIERAVIISFFSAFSIRTVYHSVTSPITSDEAWTYLTFISRGLPASMSLNYSPNNHILYSILGSLSFYLPFDSTFNLRLPSLIITFACCLLFFVSIRLLFNTLTAFLSTSLLISLYPFMYYSLQARGYLLITLLFTLCFFALFAVIKSGRREFWVIYSVAAILGAYTLPSFLYPFLSLSLFAFFYFIFQRRYAEIRRLIISGVLTGFGVLALYLPVFAVSGVATVVANEYVQPISRAIVWQSLAEYNLKLFRWFFGDLFAALFLLVCSPFLKSPKNNLLVRLSLFCLLLVPLICILHSRLPFLRIWTYLVVAIAAAAALPFEKIVAKLNLNIWAVSLLCLIILALGEYNYVKNVSADEYETRAAKTNNYMQFLADENLQNFFVEEDSTSIYVDYYLTTHHRNYKIHYGFAEAFDANQKYDCLVLKADNPISSSLEGYNLIYADDISKIFVKSR
jgi:hypothetical protein